MLEFAEILTRVIQALALMLLLGAFAFVIIGTIYMISEDMRSMVSDFESWAERRRLRAIARRSFITRNSNGNIVTMPAHLSAREIDQVLEMLYMDARGAVHQLLDPRDSVRLKKEQDARDYETLDRATEYRNDIHD